MVVQGLYDHYRIQRSLTRIIEQSRKSYNQLIYAEKVLDKIQHSSMVSSQQIRNRRSFFNLIKAIYKITGVLTLCLMMKY